MLSTEEEVIKWLRHDAPYPLFVKPNDAMLGEGAIGLTAYSNENNKLTLTNGALESMEVFVQQLRNKSSGGMLFQELLRPNPEVARICGQAISSLRITLGRTAKGLQILSACWRIPTGNNMIDNFRHGISGNLLGGIDTSTGKVTRVCGRVGKKIDPVKHHPDTGYPFENISIPDWSRVIDICTLAGEYIPGIGLQNWDVALTDRGPVITEINVFGDMDVHQFANRRGFRSDALEESLEYFYPIYLSDFSDSKKKLRSRANYLGKVSASYADVAIFVGDYANRSKEAAIEAGLSEDCVYAFFDHAQVTAFLKQFLREGDLILIKGQANHHLSRIYLGLFGQVACSLSSCSMQILCDRCGRLGFAWHPEIQGYIAPPESIV